MSQVFRRAFAKGDVAHARLQITPCMVNVHLMAPRNSGQASYILEGDSADGLPRRNSVVQAFAGYCDPVIQQNPATTPGCRAVSVVVATRLAGTIASLVRSPA